MAAPRALGNGGALGPGGVPPNTAGLLAGTVAMLGEGSPDTDGPRVT
jgi:hypothetical protein